MIIYGCGHLHVPKNWDELTYYEKSDFVKWKYSVGSHGTQEKCYNCWISSGSR